MKRLEAIKKIRQAGLSLIELMVALLISTLLMAGVVQIYIGDFQTSRYEENLALVQENGRFALEMLSREIRMAGFSGCDLSRDGVDVANTLNGGGTTILTTGSVVGYQHGVSVYPDAYDDDVLRGDAIDIIRGGNRSFTVDHHVPTSATIHLTRNHPMQPGDILMIANADCTQVGIFQMSNPQNTDGDAEIIVHNTGAAESPGNCKKELGGNGSCTSGTLTKHTYDKNSRIFSFDETGYYIGTSAAGGPALFRKNISLAGGAGGGAAVPDELVRGVSDLQIVYGIDNDGNASADVYAPANLVMDWGEVVSVRISLLMESPEDNLVPSIQTYSYDNNPAVTPPDRRIYQVFTKTIGIRNRLLGSGV